MKYRIPFQSKKERHGPALVLLHDEGAAQLQGLPEDGHKPAAHPEEALEVEAFDPVPAQNLLSFSHPVGSHDLLCSAIPHKELVVIEVIFIQVHGTVGSLPHIPEGNLPESSQLVHDLRNLGTGGAEHIKLIAGEKGVLLPDLLHFVL